MSLTKFTSALTQVLAPSTYTSLNNAVVKRVASGSVIIYLSGSGAVKVIPSKDDFTDTWIINYNNRGNAFDDVLNSYASYTVPSNTPESDALILDYYSVKERYIHFRCTSGSTSLTHRLYISSNGSNWSLVVESNASTTTSYFLKTTFRYLKITVQNTSASGVSSMINELACFSADNYIYYKSITYSDKVVFDEFQCATYYLWVEPSPALTISIYERSTPSAGSEVWVF